MTNCHYSKNPALLRAAPSGDKPPDTRPDRPSSLQAASPSWHARPCGSTHERPHASARPADDPALERRRILEETPESDIDIDILVVLKDPEKRPDWAWDGSVQKMSSAASWAGR